MAAALGIDQARLYTAVFALGAFLAGLAGALQLPREPANLGMDLSIIAEAFVVTVVGGLGSIPGAFLAALIIGLTKALCIGLGSVEIAGVAFAFPKLTHVAEFVVMAIVLALKPQGLLGAAPGMPATTPLPEQRALVVAPGRREALLGAVILVALMALPWSARRVHAGTRDRHPDGRAVRGKPAVPARCGRADLVRTRRLFRLGRLCGGARRQGGLADAACPRRGAARRAGRRHRVRLVLRSPGRAFTWPCSRWHSRRSSGRSHSSGTRSPAVPMASSASGRPGGWHSERAFYLFVARHCRACLRGASSSSAARHSAMRCVRRRDSSLRAVAVGIDVRRTQWIAFALAGAFAGLAGGLFAFSKGSISPESLAIPRSVDALVMVLLGGVNALFGPLLGAAVFTWLADTLARATDYWRAGARCADPGHRAGVPDGHRRRPRPPASSGGEHHDRSAHATCSAVLAARGLRQGLRRRAGGRRRDIRRRGRRVGRADRPQWRRQDHLLQPCQWPIGARCG